MYLTEKQFKIGLAIFVGAVIFALGVHVTYIYDQKNHYIDDSHECPSIPRVDKFKAEKQLTSQWNWRYSARDAFSAKVEQYCPTLQHDVNIFYEGRFVGRSDGKILTTVSKTFLRDCHGKKIYVLRTGDAFETIVNMNKIWVSFELREYNTDASGEENEVIAYAEQFNFFTNEFELKDKYGNKISKLYMNKYQIQKWTWEFTIYNKTHACGDPFVLMSIAGKSSFSETTTDNDGDTKDQTDMCNTYFRVVSILMLCIVSVVGAVVLIFCFVVAKDKYQNWNSSYSSINGRFF